MLIVYLLTGGSPNLLCPEETHFYLLIRRISLPRRVRPSTNYIARDLRAVVRPFLDARSRDCITPPIVSPKRANMLACLSSRSFLNLSLALILTFVLT
jgi:hypothetical protein